MTYGTYNKWEEVLQIRNGYLQFLVFDKKIKELGLLLIGNASGVFSLNIFIHEPLAKLVIPAVLKPESSIFCLKNLWIPAKNMPE
ncbi:MAG: hypothetical protein HZB81_04390 [Deltaproteobacteria bacterium]|nr:hypothetical protein [Deltaproteobacteria bacterium]